VLTRPRILVRRPSPRLADGELTHLAGLGMQVARIEPPGTLDGGDVLKVGAVVYVGQGSRTNAEGVRQLAALVEPRGRTVVPVPVTKVLHLKSGVTALPDGTVIGFEPLVDAPETSDGGHDGSITTGTGAARISFAARDPRNTRASGPAADDPMASSSSRCQSMLPTDSTQPEPVPITHGTAASMTPSATSRRCASAAWSAHESSTESSAVSPTSGGYIVA
jgi:hypothetical protein